MYPQCAQILNMYDVSCVDGIFNRIASVHLHRFRSHTAISALFGVVRVFGVIAMTFTCITETSIFIEHEPNVCYRIVNEITI